MSTERNRKVLLGMSGGVDSSVACFLLQKQGYEVTGLHLITHERSFEGLEDVREVARQAGVSLMEKDVRQEFREKVILPFAHGYCQGITPNPCILCNPSLKFKTLLEQADELGCDWVATGHYATVGPYGPTGRLALSQGEDLKKDQTYFLYRLGQSQLSRLKLPLAGMRKETVRQWAAKSGLKRQSGQSLHLKPDSQDNCFVPPEGYATYLESLLKSEAALPSSCRDPFQPGPILDEAGERIGTHRGLIHYTPGQRKGIDAQTTKRLHVLGKDLEKNALLVGPREKAYRQTIQVHGIVWSGRSAFAAGDRVQAKIRSSIAAKPCRIEVAGEKGLRVAFDEPVMAPAPGQSCVFYDGGTILAGGFIQAATTVAGDARSE